MINKQVDPHVPTLRLCYKAFGDQMFNMLFNNVRNVSVENVKNNFENKLGFRRPVAKEIARYLIEPRISQQIKRDNYDIDLKDFITNYKKLIGRCERVDDRTVNSFLSQLVQPNNGPELMELTSKLDEFVIAEYITHKQVSEVVQSLSDIGDTDNILIFLMRESHDFDQIKGEAIKTLVDKLNKESVPLNASVSGADSIINPCHKTETHNKLSDTESQASVEESVFKSDSEFMREEEEEENQSESWNQSKHASAYPIKEPFTYQPEENDNKNITHKFVIDLSTHLHNIKKTLYDVLKT